MGLEERGKTSLCSAIIRRQKDKNPPLATLGVVKTDWYYKGRPSTGEADEQINEGGAL